MPEHNGFRKTGNLTFYDGWSPDYVYFKSLLAYADTISDDHHGGWDPDEAMRIANKAVQDAQSHLHLNNDKEESEQYFLEKFNQIIDFLEKAIIMEKANEKAYIEQLYKQLKSSFSAQERKELKALHDLEKILKDAETKDSIEYDQMNTLINVLLQGFKNTKTVLAYEEERIKKINAIVTRLLASRRNQTYGLHKNSKDSITLQKISDDSLKRLYKNFETEYASTGQLTRRSNNGKGPFVLWGGATIETEVPKAIDRVMAEWVEKMMGKIANDKKFIKKIQSTLYGNYPADGNFKFLEDKIQEDIIQAVIQSGISDLSTMLNTEITNEIIKQTEKNIQKNGFDLTAQLKINNLTSSFGLIGRQIKLMEQATEIKDLEGQPATQLFDAIRRLIEEEQKQSEATDTKSESLLIKAMKKNRTSKQGSALDRTQQMISLIETIEKLQKKQKQLNKQWRKIVGQINDTRETLSKDFKISNEASITIEIKDGKPEIILNNLLNDNRMKLFGFKTFNPKSLETMLNTLKARASLRLRDEVINSLKKANFNISERDLITHVSQELKNVRVRINGPTLAELMVGLYLRKTGDDIVLDWNNYKGKNDFVQIMTDHRGIITKFHSTQLYKNYKENSEHGEVQTAIQQVEQAQTELLLEFQKNIDSHVKTLTKDNDLQKYSKLQEYMQIDIKADEESKNELEQQYAKLEKATKDLMHQIKVDNHSGLSNEQINELGQAYLNTLKNSFYVSTTVKSANDYMNSIGFKGGTLGPTLNDQLSRVNDIFTSAGMPIPQNEYDWLKSAIINCFSDSVVGEKNKNLLENYLGSLAAFALFDEGGVESQIINKFRDKLIKSINEGKAQKIIHLYVVDGIYVKGSTVLERTLNTIKNEVIPYIQEIPKTMRRGAGIMILNTAVDNKTIIPNRPYKDHLNNPDSNAWARAGKTVADKHVKLQILFLAGLMDIIKKINNTLSKVETPK